MTLAEVAARTGGRLVDATGAETVTGPVVVDSRTAAPGSLFVAVPGEHLDGHDFAAAAVARGAAGVLGARRTGVPSVLVQPGQDAAVAVMSALGRLARAALDTTPAVRVSAVTGSSGKTSTKDLLAQVLPAAGPTVASPGSYNNDVGLPLTVLELDAATRHLVLEMGARGQGDIARLCRIAPPATGVVLNVGLAHVGEFGSRAAIARAKAELVEALRPDGVAVLNADDPLVVAMAGRTSARVLTFSVGQPDSQDPAAAADVRAERVRLDAEGRPSFRLELGGEAADVTLQLVGAHHVANAVAAAAAGWAAGLDVAEVAGGLQAARPLSRWRMEVHHRPDGVTVVNDAYNANPDSMRAGLRALMALGTGPSGTGPSGRGRRTWAVLGEMLELGGAAAGEHAALGRFAADLGVDRLVAVGDGARGIADGATAAANGAARSRREAPVLVPDLDSAMELLRRELRAGDVVLVKSSRDAGLRRLGEALVADATPAEPRA